MAVKQRTCLKCKQTKVIDEFIFSHSIFLPLHHSIICKECYENMTDATNLNVINKLFQHLDLPFNPDLWTQLYETYREHTLTAYLNRINSEDNYISPDWNTENEKWRIAREEDLIEERMEVLNKAEERRLRRKWSEMYTVAELRFLEDYYNQIIATQNVSTPILREYACDLCELELQIKKGVRNGDDVKKLMDARDNIVKIACFEASNSKNAADFDTVGEVLTYYVKKGWHPNWHTEPQDSVDFCMDNIQKYLRRLVTNEGNFAEQVEAKRETFNMTERLINDEDEIDEDKYLNTDTVDSYEDDDKFLSELGGE